MINFIYSLPAILLYGMISLILIIFSVVAVCLVNRFYSYDARYLENQALSGITATIGIFYALLMSISVLYVLTNYGNAERVVQKEANFVADLYRDSNLLSDPFRTTLQTDIKNYLQEVIYKEWPILRTGKIPDNHAHLILNKITNEVKFYKATNSFENLTLRAIADEVKNIYDSSQERFRLIDSALGGDVWLTIILGTLLTLGINCFYGMEFRLHLVAIVAISLVIASMIYLNISIDRPFIGEFSVQPEPYITILNDMNS